MSAHSTPVTPSPLTADSRALAVDALYEPLSPLRRIGGKHGLKVLLDENAYDPKADPFYDWVHRVALPSFLEYSRNAVVDRFCTVGTGTGTDALAAIEIFGPRLVALTDLEGATVELAMRNVVRNLKLGQAVEIRCGVGDLLSPFGAAAAFDLIYENLPNIPLSPAEQRRLLAGRNRATYYSQRSEEVKPSVRENLLELHWLCLRQARALLAEGGAVLSSIGARRPIANIRSAMSAEEFEQSVEMYTWKIQSEPEEVIGGFAAQDRPGRRFHFYPVDVLQRAFQGLTPSDAAANAAALEAALETEKIPATEALKRSRAGEPIGHTVLVLCSRAV